MATNNTQEEVNVVTPNHAEGVSAGDKVAKYKKLIFGIVTGVIVVVLGGLGWWYYNKTTNEKSSKAFTTAYVNAMKKGDEAAIKKEMETVAKNEAGKAGATLANLELAGLYMNNDEYQKALTAIEATDIKEPLMKMSSLLLKGDCYVGLKKYNEAQTAYTEAFNMAKDTNSEVAVRALMKQASVLDAQKKHAEALAIYEQIQKDYPDALEQAAQFAGQNPDMTPLTADEVEAKAENERARTGK